MASNLAEQLGFGLHKYILGDQTPLHILSADESAAPSHKKLLEYLMNSGIKIPNARGGLCGVHPTSYEVNHYQGSSTIAAATEEDFCLAKKTGINIFDL